MNGSIIEQATLHDMEFLLASAKAEGWNPGISDASAFYFTDPNGFFIEKLNNKPIGCISAAVYTTTYAFMGFYIILPEFRHHGYGMKLWNHALAYLGDRTIGLDGVVAQQENYKKSGFKFYYNNIRFTGTPRGRISQELQPIDTIPFPILVDFDTSIYGVNRNVFLQHWISMPHSFGFAKMLGNELLGYGMARKCEIGFKIGPLFAENFEIANEIFLSLVAQCEGAEIFLDLVQTNSEGMKLAKEHKLNKVFETARMYKGSPPKQILQKVFGITTFELG